MSGAAPPTGGELASADETRAFGARLAGCLRAGDLVVLTGPLGAGKTTLVQGLAAGLGARGPVTSPTFVLARRHPGPLPLLHVDAYRIRDAGPDGLEGLDLEPALEEGVVVVEWGEDLVERVADAWLAVTLDRPAGDETRRTVAVRGHGPRWASC